MPCQQQEKFGWQKKWSDFDKKNTKGGNVWKECHSSRRLAAPRVAGLALFLAPASCASMAPRIIISLSIAVDVHLFVEHVYYCCRFDFDVPTTLMAVVQIPLRKLS
jgi:hypothetical protein